jgi:hypothetical protein
VSSIRLYFDEDSLADALIQALRNEGLDVRTALEEGSKGSSDIEQLRRATEQQRVMYTFNVRDYYQLHTSFLSQGERHAGIVLAQQQRFSNGEQLRGILRICAERTAEDMMNEIVFLSAWINGIRSE